MTRIEVRTCGPVLVWGVFQPLRRRDWHHLRREIGHAIPDDYRSFMEVANGGVLPYSVSLPPGGDGEPIGFNELHTVTPDPRGDYAWGTVIGERRQMQDAYWADVVPSDCIPVASDGGGCQLFIRVSEGHSGEVWAFVHGLPAWAGGDEKDSGGIVAPSWNDFLDLLYIDDDLAEIQWSDSADQPEWRASVVRWLDGGMPGWRDRSWAVDT
jgi:hypothetical protein